MAPIGSVASIEHAPQDPPVNRLEAVASIRQSSGNDDGHGVLEERLFHLRLDLDRLDVVEAVCVEFVAVCRRALWWLIAHVNFLRCPRSERRRRSSG